MTNPHPSRQFTHHDDSPLYAVERIDRRSGRIVDYLVAAARHPMVLNSWAMLADHRIVAVDDLRFPPDLSATPPGWWIYDSDGDQYEIDTTPGGIEVVCLACPDHAHATARPVITLGALLRAIAAHRQDRHSDPVPPEHELTMGKADYAGDDQ